MRLFEIVYRQRNERSVEKKVPENFLLTDDHAALCHWLCTALVELRKEDNGKYTPRSLSRFIAGLQRYISNAKGCAVTVYLQILLILRNF